MTRAKPAACTLAALALLFGSNDARAQNWPQWRGANRDARATGFTAPKTWPKELTQKWKVNVGAGLASPALVDDKLYVFSYEKGNDILRCLDAATGKELWKDEYAASNVTGIAAGRSGEFAGTRSSPTVAEGKVVTLGSHGTLSCNDAATGKKVWRKDDFKRNLPMFSAATSPIIVKGMCILQFGGERRGGGIVAYDLASGDEKWKWTGDGSTYASPTILTLGTDPVLIAETASKIVGVGVGNGKLLWETPFAVRGRGYNAISPLVQGQTVLYAGSSRGIRAVKLDKKGDAADGKELWNNKEISVNFSTPVLHDHLLFGISERDSLFCINAETGKKEWTTSVDCRRGYGTLVDAGSVMMVLTPSAQLIVFEPTAKEFKEVAKYKLAGRDTYAYPVVSGNRVFVKDRDSVTLWTIE